MLYLSSNPLNKLDITPILACPELELFSIETNVELIADLKLKEANDLPPFTRDYEEEINWVEM
jgi:hypothetical protein